MSEGDIGFARGATTDAEGGFAFENTSPGTRCLLRAYLGESMSPEDHVASPQDRRPIALRLAENVRPNVTGTIVTGGGRSVPYALVRAMCSGAAGPGQPSLQWRTLICNAMADADGRFSMRKLWPGMNYSLRVRAGAYSEESVEVEPLAPGEARDVGDISLAVADLAVSGRVVDDKGNPVPNVVVDAERVEGHFSRRKMAITDLEGRFTLEALPRESLRLVADRFASNSTYASIGPNHDPRTEVVIKAIPRDKQILFTHELDPPLQGQEANVKATLSRLLRYKSFSPDGEIGHYLGLDFDGPRDPDTGRSLFAWVFDGKRRPLPAARAQAYIGQKNIPGFELPATGSSVLSRVLIGYLHMPASEWPLRIGPLQPQLPFEDRNRGFVLWSVGTTDEWLQPSLPGEPVTPGDPPYLLAHVYAVVSETERYLPAMAQTAPEGLELVPAAAFYYSLEQDTLELPQNLAEMQEALKEEAERALMALVDWGVVLPEPAVIAGYLFQSTGGHGAIAPPEGITVELTPLAYPAVAFDNIPLPEELTAGE